ncbi:MAG: HD-GYP domain-containing protein, partial [Halomonadaceae bacterium]
KFHRERHNGRGFPQRVNGEAIPLLAKLSGLVDYYESLIEPRPGVEPLNPAQAVGKLFEVRNQLFQEDLVERFIQAVGIYPTGTIVKLNNQQTGLVLSHRPHRRLWPKVMVVADEQQRPLKAGRIIDLVTHNEGKNSDEALSISGCLPFGIEGIDPSGYEIVEPEAGKRWSLKSFLKAGAG